MKTINKIEHLDRVSPLAYTVVVLSMFSGFYYSAYFLNTNNKDNVLLYLVFVIIEVYVVLTSLFTWWTIIFHDKDSRKDSIEITKNYDLQKFADKKIAIIVPCYTEPLKMVEEAIIAAKNINFPHEVFIGDDGKREEVKQLCLKYNVNYSIRDNNRHFKSGNLHNIITKLTDFDFIAIFDVDHKPDKTFLNETLPYFLDEKVAYIQTPQFYENTNNIISKGASGSQNIFYELIMPGKNAFNSAICVGTNVIFRKKALDEVFGGFYLAEHSEDIWAGLKLHEAGWKSIYIPRVLAKGLAPDNVSTYFKQQERWARGGFEIFIKNNPLFSKKLTIEQKLQYFFTSTHYFSGFVILVYLLLPILYLMTGQKALAGRTGTEWWLHYIPFFLSKFLLMVYLIGKFDFALISSSMALFPVYIKAFFREVTNTKYTWVVTNTGIKQETSLVDYLFWHFSFVIISIIAIIVGFMTYENLADTVIFSTWTAINILIMCHFIYYAIKIDYVEGELLK